MIKITDLTKDDIGRWVIFKHLITGIYPNVPSKEGRIKGWNEEYIFVVYGCDNQWHRFYDFNANATNPDNLTFKYFYRSDDRDACFKIPPSQGRCQNETR